MATLYFNGAVDNDWDELGNWWTNEGHTTAATALPTSSDSVVLSANCGSNSGSAPTVVNLMVSAVGLGITITVTGMATFNSGSLGYYDGGLDAEVYGVVNGNATFDDGYLSLYGTVNGNVTMTDSTMEGQINGDATFTNTTGGFGAQITGDAVFNGTSETDTEVGGDAVFNDSTSALGGTVIAGNATFNDTSSYGGDTITGTATFNDSAVYYVGAMSLGIFNDSASIPAETSVTADLVMNDSSTIGSGSSVEGDITQNGNSSVVEISVLGDVTLNNNSEMNASVTGSVVVNDNSVFYGASVTGDVTVNDISSTADHFVSSHWNDDRLVGVDGAMSIGGDLIFSDGHLFTKDFVTDSGISVDGDIYFNSSTAVSFVLSDNQYWYSDASPWIFANANSAWTFNDTSWNSGTVRAATFNDAAGQDGTVSQNAVFNDASANAGIVEGDASFNDTAYNSFVVNGLSTFSLPAASYTIAGQFGSGTYNGGVDFAYEKGVNGSSILGVI